jgi:hypothetical protein
MPDYTVMTAPWSRQRHRLTQASSFEYWGTKMQKYPGAREARRQFEHKYLLKIFIK